MVLWMAVPWRCSLLFPSDAPPVIADGSGSATTPAVVAPPARPYGPKTDEVLAKRETLNGHKPPPRPVTLPDEVIVRAMDVGRVAFVRCFKKAAEANPSVRSFKVRLHVELDAKGAATSASTDSDDAGLTRCLQHVAYRLPFPGPGQPAVVELPLFYRAE
jgi:hypothetical protein